MRIRTIAFLLLLLAASCGRGADDVGIATPTPTAATGSETPAPTSEPGDELSTPDPAGGGADEGPGGGGEQPPPPQEGGDGEPAPPPPPGSGDDDGPPGARATTYLRGHTPKLTIEIDAVDGKAPSQSTVNHLKASLVGVLDKPQGIVTTSPETFGPRSNRYTLEDIRALEDAHRDTHTTSGNASLYALYLNGRFAEDGSVLGLTFSASAFAIFTDAVRSAATPLVAADRIERSVTLHEVGHLLRLINIGYDSPRNREDPDHCMHSTNRSSVMFWAVESDLVTQVLSGPPPDSFDDADLADLSDIKHGRVAVGAPEFECG